MYLQINIYYIKIHAREKKYITRLSVSNQHLRNYLLGT